MSTLKATSELFGALYVIAWSASFYPPMLLNYRLRSSEGLSVDFLFMNIVGYIALVSSMSMLLFNTEVRTLYYERHGYSPLLSKIDLIYSVHGLIMTFVTTSQLFCWGFKPRSVNPRRLTKLIILLVFTLVASAYYCVGGEKSESVLTLLDLAIFLSYVKIFMSLIKYIPQLSHNHKRRSVVGFSMSTILLDTTGGVLSICQLFLDSYIATGELNGDVLINNGGKLGLSFVTLFFDSCFIYQWLTYEKRSSAQDHNMLKSDLLLA